VTTTFSGNFELHTANSWDVNIGSGLADWHNTLEVNKQQKYKHIYIHKNLLVI